MDKSWYVVFVENWNDRGFFEADGDSRLLKWDIEDVGDDYGEVVGAQFQN